LVRLADRCGALLAVSAAAKGLFEGDRWNLDISGGFATDLAAELIGAADPVVAWGSTLNMWTTRHQRLIGPHATVVQVDRDPTAIGVNRKVDLGAAVARPDRHPLGTVTFPDTDLAAIARGYGCDAVTVTAVGDLGRVRDRLAGDGARPMLVDAKVSAEHGSWWLEEAFTGH
jgi:thiamine pyrophosphate-dependent acetolactate synthase large subunit-like protein